METKIELALPDGSHFPVRSAERAHDLRDGRSVDRAMI
jgi:hypothetical protein